jgi:hypothetical protein
MGIIHFCLNSIAVNLFIIRRSRTILNHGLSSFFSLPPEYQMSGLEKISHISSLLRSSSSNYALSETSYFLPCSTIVLLGAKQNS